MSERLTDQVLAYANRLNTIEGQRDAEGMTPIEWQNVVANLVAEIERLRAREKTRRPRHTGEPLDRIAGGDPLDDLTFEDLDYD